MRLPTDLQLKPRLLWVRVVSFASAGATEGFAVAHDFALEVDAFAAFGADDPGAFETWKILGVNFYFHPFL